MALTAGSIEIKLFADLARLQSDMNKANKNVDAAMRNIDKSVGIARRAFAGLSTSFGALQIIKLADDYKRFDSQLQLATKNLDTYTQSYENVIRISRIAQSDIGAIGVLYARLNNNLRDFNVTQMQVSDVSETIALALRTNNATVQETSSVMLQLSQSFGSGRLNGQEFLAVAEGAPMLLRQLAKSMGVPYGAMKDLSAQGKITRDELLKAWTDPAYLAALRNQVKEVGTISSAITVLMNNIKVFIGEQDKATGSSKVITKTIMLLADNINLLATVAIAGLIVATGRWVAGIYASVTASRLRQIELVKEQVLLERKVAAEAAASFAIANNARAVTMAAKANSAAMAETVAVNAAVAARMTVAARAAGVLRGAMAALGGPIGAIITLLGLGVTAWMTWGDQGKTSANEIADALKRVKDGMESINDAKMIQLAKNAAEAERRQLQMPRSGLQTAGDVFSYGSVEAASAARAERIRELDVVIKEYNKSLEQHNKNKREEIVANDELAPLYDKLAKAGKILSFELAEQNQLIADAKRLYDAHKITLADYNKVVADANKKKNDLLGLTKSLKEEQKEEEKTFKKLTSIYADMRKESETLVKVDIQSFELLQKRLDLTDDLIGADRALIQSRIDYARNEYEVAESIKQANEQMEATQQYDDAMQEKVNSTSEAYNKILQETQDINIDMIQNEKDRARAQIEIEHQRRMETIALMEAEQEQKDLLLEAENDRYEAAMKKQSQQLLLNKNIVKDLGLTFQSAFEDAIVSGKKLSEVLQSIGQDIIKIFARKLVTEPLVNSIGGSLQSLFPSILSGGGYTPLPDFVPAFASGGNPPVGVPSLVGERGPELFVPNTAGTIVPNHQLGGDNISVVVNVSNDGSDVQSSAEMGRNLGNVIKNAVQAELLKQKRQGGLLA